MGSELVTHHHLDRRAVVYVRQSTPHQVLTNQESLRLQYALRARAHQLGWHEADIEVVDADLGLSGASVAGREGFKNLVARVALGEVGLILSIEVTRLARNCSDWYPLLDLCGRHGCLIGDRDGLYDPALPDGRLVLGLKGTVSEMELYTIRSRLTSGLLAKAARGELALQLPTGFVRDPSGVVIQDPNCEVRSRIALVFSTFLERRTTVRVVGLLRARDLTLPRRDQHGDICWRAPTIAAVTSILRNPAYAGAFVYGRTRLGPPGANGRQKQRRRSAAEWRIVVRDKYPAYVDWDTFERIQAIMANNHADYQSVRGGRGITRNGAALLHGITWCGECGHKMTVRYKGGCAYACTYLQRQHGSAHTECLRAPSIDEAVSKAFLEAVAPAELEALARAERARRDAEADLRRAEEQQLQRLRYEASLAERQYRRVDPDNRLVAAELERRWEASLVGLRRAEEALARRQDPVPARTGMSDRQLRARAAELGGQLPEIWADPATAQVHRKALLRCLIDKVVLTRLGRDRAGVRIVWRGGAVTPLEVDLPVNALAALPRAAEMEARVIELA
ncbi:recombinase family protein [Pseudoroseomonas ludipueritiae]|uniref:Recombinase family protein n=1 Tax=Pseudoroseomonas ludipueritiae TaxID=198093 RepID=A0ABR7REN2_9PROT|nr:recombinase family protein [Pseudoroseomonas ludipueritiae]MBC9180119.1 recombinase family protein [Pseudoroseomonas ludipueritiae]